MIWPFKPKMTVDHLAYVFAKAIEDSSLIYQEAFENHAAENIKHIDEEILKGEAWIMEMFLLRVVIDEINAPTLVKEKLLPMVLVGYSSINKEWYLARERFYRSKLHSAVMNADHNVLSAAIVEVNKIEFKTTREDVNEQALTWALGLVILSSKDGIGSLLGSALSKYRIL